MPPVVLECFFKDSHNIAQAELLLYGRPRPYHHPFGEDRRGNSHINKINAHAEKVAHKLIPTPLEQFKSRMMVVENATLEAYAQIFGHFGHCFSRSRLNPIMQSRGQAQPFVIGVDTGESVHPHSGFIDVP